MTVPEAQRDPRLRRFRLRRHKLHCAGACLSVVAPARGDDLLEGDGALRALRERQMPYWADIWPASVGLARWLMRGGDLSGVRALDLGCGIGVAGLAAATRGAEVCFADLAAEALDFARFNTRGFDPRRLRFEQFDWFRRTLEGPFDLLLLADVSYEERNFDPLIRHLREALAPSGRALLCDPFRAAGDHFLARVGAEGYHAELESFDTSFSGDRIPLRLATLRRSDATSEPPPIVPASHA